MTLNYADILRKGKPRFVDVLKWNPNQLRGPKGSPTGGQWVKGRSTGGGTIGAGDEGWKRRPYTNMGSADYADIMNAPIGTGFGNRPRAVGFTPPQTSQTSQTSATSSPKKSNTLEALSSESVKDTRPLSGGGANASMIVTLESGVEAVFKPEAGENWTASFMNSDISRKITNRDFSLAGREAFAFEVGDKLMGADNPVPETVLRETVEGVDLGSVSQDEDEGNGGWADEDLREMYDDYRQKKIDSGSAYDEVNEEMGNLFDEAQKEHFEDIERRAEEIAEIWNEEIKDFPDDGPYGSGSAQREHAVLPLGSQEPFERKEKLGVLDPIDLMDDANVDPSYKFTDSEKKDLRAKIRERLEEGYQELGDVDEDKAKEHLDRDEWMMNHADTENRLLDEQIKSFSAWKQSMGYQSYHSGGGSGGVRNSDAPHPHGGSFQHYRGNTRSYGNLSDDDAARMAVLDYVIGSMDRHGQNLLFDDDRPVAIDNGYSMPAVKASRMPDGFTFRSVAVDMFMGRSESKKVSASVREPILESWKSTDWQAMLDRHPGMNASERQAFLGRVEKMKLALANERDLYRLWETLDRM